MIRSNQILINKFFLTFLYFSIAFSSCKKSYHTRDIMYKNDDIEISARVYIPPGEGRFPAVVIVPSAEPVTKDEYSAYAEYFSSHGIATLCYDKRGSGKSTGNIWLADFDDLLNDALSGIQYLKTLPYIDTAKMGFLGHSQGGMYIFKSDRVSDDVAFVIDASGSPRTPLSQSDYNIRFKILEKGGESTYADSLAVLMDRYIIYLRKRENFAAIKKSYDQLIANDQKPIADEINYFGQFNYLKSSDSLPAYGEMEMYPFMRSYDFEPGAFYPGLKIPGLVVYGRKDKVIPVETCIERVKELQPESPNIELKIFDDANHAMKTESISGQKYADGYFQFLAQWILDHTAK